MTDAHRTGESAAVITVGGAALARTWFEPICTLFDEVFSVPPHRWTRHESTAHRSRLAYMLGNPTFTLGVAATPRPSGEADLGAPDDTPTAAGSTTPGDTAYGNTGPGDSGPGEVEPTPRDLLVGFCYGYALPEHTSWWRGFTTPPPDEVTREWPGRTFAVADLAVRAGWRRRGIGRRLLDAVLAERPETRATLSVQPQIAENHAFYEHLGWRLVGRQRGLQGEASPYFDIYLLPLRDS